MFTPVYTVTPNLLKIIGLTERLYGQLEALRIPEKLQLNLTRHNLIRSSYTSNKIEGNPLTLPEVTNLLLDDRVPTNRDEKEVVNYFNILKNLNTYTAPPLSLELMIKLHRQLMAGVDKSAGEVRNVQVVVGRYKNEHGNATLKVKHDPPYHTRDKIEAALSELFAWTEAEVGLPVILKAGIFHHEFVRIHPFEDGNGRVCRILTGLIFLKTGYHINRYFILDDYYDIDRDQYSDSLHSADSGDKTRWLEYFGDGVRYSLQSAVAKYKQSLMMLKFDEKPTPKEREVLDLLQEQVEITTQDVAGKLEVTRQQAHNLLRGLVDKGLVDKKGKTKSSYYFLK
jgi:Fic family protein